MSMPFCLPQLATIEKEGTVAICVTLFVYYIFKSEVCKYFLIF